MGLVIRKTSHMIRGLRLWASLTLGKGRGLETEFNHVANDLINRANVVRSQCKSWTPELVGASWWANTRMCWDRGVAWSHGQGALHLGLSQHLPSSSFHLAVPALYPWYCNDEYSAFLSSGGHSIIADCQIRGAHGRPWIAARWSEVWVTRCLMWE